jgi:hypothetical protein
MFSDCASDIKFSGVNLEGGFRSFFELELENLLEEAPSDSSVSSYFRKMKDGYSGIVNIVSSQGRFVAEAASQDLNEIVASIKAQIHQQLAQWRENRDFSECDEAGLAADSSGIPGFARRAVQAFESWRRGENA